MDSGHASLGSCCLPPCRLAWPAHDRALPTRTRSALDFPHLFRATPRRRSATSSTGPTWREGQTGLSVAFDLPTQTGYDSDHVLARGEVGKVGVPVGHLGDMRALFDGIPLERMNTSMTINAPAAWLLALYVALAEEQGADPRDCKAQRRTTS